MMAITPNTPPPVPPERRRHRLRPGIVEIEEAIRRAEHAQDKFQEELDGLIEDLHEARDAIKDNPLPGERGE